MSVTDSLPNNQGPLAPGGADPDRSGNVVPFDPSGALLIVFEDARRALADAETAEQINKILALATGLAAAARKATDRETEAEAEALKLEAVRRLGQLMAAQKKAIGFNKGGGDQRSDHRDSKKPGDLLTLAEAGIDKNLADKARKAAALSEMEFEAAKKAKREAVLARTRLGTHAKPDGGRRSNPRKSRFDAEHYALRLGQDIQNLATLPKEHSDRFDQVLDHFLSDADSIDALATLARHPKSAAVLAAVTARLGGESLLHAQPDADLSIENLDLRGEVEELHDEIDALKARIADLTRECRGLLTHPEQNAGEIRKKLSLIIKLSDLNPKGRGANGAAKSNANLDQSLFRRAMALEPAAVRDTSEPPADSSEPSATVTADLDLRTAVNGCLWRGQSDRAADAEPRAPTVCLKNPRLVPTDARDRRYRRNGADAAGQGNPGGAA